MTAVRQYRPTPTADDIRWTEDRAIELVKAGLSLVDACELAARECTARILDRSIQAYSNLEAMRAEQRAERRREQDAKEQERRAAIEAKATLGQRPTLKTSLGDKLAQALTKRTT